MQHKLWAPGWRVGSRWGPSRPTRARTPSQQQAFKNPPSQGYHAYIMWLYVMVTWSRPPIRGLLPVVRWRAEVLDSPELVSTLGLNVLALPPRKQRMHPANSGSPHATPRKGLLTPQRRFIVNIKRKRWNNFGGFWPIFSEQFFSLKCIFRYLSLDHQSFLTCFLNHFRTISFPNLVRHSEDTTQKQAIFN